MFAKLLLLFILVPLIDLLILLGITKLTHWIYTVAAVVASGLLGAWLAKRQADSVGKKIRTQLMDNNIPSGLLTDGAMILFAAGLLITPGLITDLFGLTLLIPQTRDWYKRRAIVWLKNHFRVEVNRMSPAGFSSDVVDGEVVATHSDDEKSSASNGSDRAELLSSTSRRA